MKLGNIDILNNELVLVNERDNTIVARNIPAGENCKKDCKGKIIGVDWKLAEAYVNKIGYTLY